MKEQIQTAMQVHKADAFVVRMLMGRIRCKVEDSWAGGCGAVIKGYGYGYGYG
jgi:hypothetical protein